MKNVWKKLTGLILAVMLLSSATGSIFAAETQGNARKYQLIDYTCVNGQAVVVLFVEDEAETEFYLTYEFVGTKPSASGIIENGEYIPEQMDDIVTNEFPHIIEQVTQDWTELPASDGTLYTVTFDSNYEKQTGNTIQVDAATVVSGNNLLRFGYTFTGWYMDEECTEPLAEHPFVTSDTTVYAGWEPWDDKTMELMELYQETSEKTEYMMLRKPAYEETSFNAMYEMAFTMFLAVEAGGVVIHSEEEAGLLFGTIQAMNAVEQIADPEDYAWDIWGEQMASESTDNYEFYGFLDDEKYRPVLTPFMLKDQSQVKGNIILASGGAFFLRSNIEEAYPSAQKFNELGYNVFVLQRRVLPFNPNDSGLDMQRAVRYLKYHAQDLGIGAIDHMAVGGYSGGGGTVYFYALNYYGDIQPDSVYADYIPDEIDHVNSDVDAILSVYSAIATFDGKVTEIGVDMSELDIQNPNWPATFIVSGVADTSVYPEKSINLFETCKELNSQSELHLFANAPHGFGSGYPVVNYMGEGNWLDGYAGAGQWISLADTFLMQVFGIIEPTYSSVKQYKR